jgi:hypothetical protein
VDALKRDTAALFVACLLFEYSVDTLHWRRAWERLGCTGLADVEVIVSGFLCDLGFNLGLSPARMRQFVTCEEYGTDETVSLPSP